MNSVPIPYQSRDQELGEILALGLDQRIESDEERHIVGHLLVESAFERGVKSVGDLLDLEPERKRALLDRARVSAGLKTIKQEEIEQANQNLSVAGRSGICASPQCTVTLIDPVTGAPTVSRQRRWFCAEHTDQARPEDWDVLEMRMDAQRPGQMVEVVVGRVEP
jgi:hypothetical protein